MKPIFWSAIVGLLAFAAMYALFRKGIAPLRLDALNPADTISLLVNVMVFIVAVVSLFIALAAYQDTKESGEKQQKILESSREALEAAVASAGKQQQLLDQNLKISSEHLALVREQWAQEQERLGRKPKVEIGFGQFKPAELERNPNITINWIGNSQYQSFDFFVTNTGKAAVYKPEIMVKAIPETVYIFELGGPRKNVLHFSRQQMEDILPFETTQLNYQYRVNIAVPQNVNEFNIEFHIYGENLPRKILRLHMIVVRQPIS